MSSPTGKITALKIQQRDPDRVSVFLDDQFWIGIRISAMTSLGISQGEQIDSARSAEILAAAAEDKAFSYALNRISYSSISEAALTAKLKERDHSEKVIEIVIDRCRQLGLLNDQALAASWVEQGIRSNRGQQWIEMKMREKGIPDRLIEEAVTEGFAENDELLSARQALEKMLRSERIDRRDQDRFRARLIRRGFSPSAAAEVISERKMSEDEEAELHSVDEAREFIQKRYQRITVADQNRVYAALARRHFLPDIIRQAIEFELKRKS